MKTTPYFENTVIQRRPYLKREWCERVRKNPETKTVQDNGRIAHWGWVPEFADAGEQFKGRGRYLLVVTEPDGETIHNAYPDRNYAG